MAVSRLEELPLEILQHITAHLTDPTHEAVSAFSRCSSTCHQAASYVLYSTIRLRISVPENPARHNQAILGDSHGFNEEVSSWSDILHRHTAYHQVKRLEIKEHITVIRQFPKWLEPDRPNPDFFDLLDRDDDFIDTPPASLSTPLILRDVTYPTEKEECTMWQRFMDLMDRLHSLSDIRFNHSRPIPSCVVKELGRRSRSLKVHLSKFWFPGYLTMENLDPPELPYILSLRPEAIMVRSCGYAYNGGTDFTPEGIVEIVNSANSRVKHLSLFTDAKDMREWMARALGEQYPRCEWTGFAGAHTVTASYATPLSSFELGGTGPVLVELLKTCFRSCNMTKLTILKLHIRTTHKGLSWLACNIDLPSLKTLALGLYSNYEQGETCEEQDLAGMFLGSLPPLRELRFISDVSPDTLAITLQKHGQTLRRLWFPPPQDDSEVLFNVDRVAELERSCPNLEDLWIPIPRSLGDETEVTMYKTLGALPRLCTLSLALDCEDTSLGIRTEGLTPTAIYDGFDDHDAEEAVQWTMQPGGCHQPRNGHTRLAILNAALDETLARQIFHTIASAKPIGDANLPLERLELRPCRGIYTAESKEVVEVVGQWWLLGRVPVLFPAERNPVRATKIRCPGDVYEEIYGPPTTLEEKIEPIVRKIWPQVGEGDAEWAEKWESLPLATI